MSTTRLIMLGAVRIFQPVHGYFLLRELKTWHVDQWAAMHPGSIYSALRLLTRDGFLAESGAGGKDRKTYAVTPDGEALYFELLREVLWRIDLNDPSRLMAAVAFWWTLSREEVVSALESRLAQLEAALRESGFQQTAIEQDPTKPPHVVEYVHLGVARGEAERAWTRDVLERIRGGAYSFGDEPPDWQHPASRAEAGLP